MASIFDRFQAGSQSAGRPPTAVELSATGALAAAVPLSGPPVFAFAALRAGSLVPGIEETNLRAPDAVANAIRAALDPLSPRSRAITLVLPDAV